MAKNTLTGTGITNFEARGTTAKTTFVQFIVQGIQDEGISRYVMCWLVDKALKQYDASRELRRALGSGVSVQVKLIMDTKYAELGGFEIKEIKLNSQGILECVVKLGVEFA